MSVAVEQVPKWRIIAGVGCAVQHEKGNYAMTLCGTWGNVGTTTEQRPKRICSKCRKALAVASLLAGDGAGVNEGEKRDAD